MCASLLQFWRSHQDIVSRQLFNTQHCVCSLRCVVALCFTSSSPSTLRFKFERRNSQKQTAWEDWPLHFKEWTSNTKTKQKQYHHPAANFKKTHIAKASSVIIRWHVGDCSKWITTISQSCVLVLSSFDVLSWKHFSKTSLTPPLQRMNFKN